MRFYHLISYLTPLFGVCNDGNGSDVHKSMLHWEVFLLKGPQARVEQEVTAFSY